MVDLPVQIVRFVEEHQPPIVEAKFCDSMGCFHTFIDKCAIFTEDWFLDATSKYPQPGAIRCDILARFRGPDGQELVRVRTEVESADGLFEFVVLANQLTSALPEVQPPQ